MKRIMCTVLVLILIIPFAPTCIYADTDISSIVGIPSDLSSHKIIKQDPFKNSDKPNLIENTQIVNFGDHLGVYSCPVDNYYSITSASLKSALLNANLLNSSYCYTHAGYDINYYSPAGEIATSDTVVSEGGFIRAEKDGENTLDIPIKTSRLLKYIDGPDIGSNWRNIADGTEINRNSTGVGGKSESDKCIQFTVKPGTTISPANPTRADTTGFDVLNSPKSVITLEFLIHVTGDVTANVEMDGGRNLFKLSGDGIMTYYSYDKGKYVDVKVCDDASEWHNVAITYDYAGNRIRYAFDGKILETSGNLTSSVLTQIRFGPESKTHTEGGTVAFDSLKISRGYCNFERNVLDIQRDNGKIYVFPRRNVTSGVLVAARYDRSGTMTKIEISDDSDFLEISESSSALKYKAMLFDSLDNITPLLEASEYDSDGYREINIGERVILNCDFENGFLLAHHANGSIIEQRKEDDGNTVLYMERIRETDFHISALGFNHQTDCIVAEFDLKVMDPATYFYIKYKDATAVENSYAYIASGGILVTKNKSTSLQMDKWYRISQVINLYDRVIDTYVDGVKIDTEILKSNFAVNNGVELFRFHVPPTYDPEKDKVKFMTDNIRIYEGAEPKDEIGEITYDIDLTLESYVPDDESTKSEMNGYFSVHTMSGIAFANGEKKLLNKKPWKKDNETYVDGIELSDFFGLRGNFTSEMSIAEFADVSKLIPTKVDYDFNSGLYIFGESSFKIPEDKEKLQEINDFLFYLRPDSEKIYNMYKESPAYGKHPRIQATKDDFERIRELINTDENMKRWSEIVIKNADNLFKVPPVKYELRDGVRLLMVAREALSNMYALGFAYQITGEQKYADRAWLDLEAVCVEFWDWHPSHIIDTGELMAAVAIGYDWMYDGFTDDQRAKIEKGIHDKGFYEAVLGTQSEAAAMHGGMLFDESNHNVVTNGGLLMASMAFMDVYPDISSYLAHSAVRCVEINLDKFAPDGAYFEGPHYWEYTMQYTSKMLSALDGIFGNCFALDMIEGLSTASEYMIYMQTSNGIYNYGDGTQLNVYPPEMLWLNNKYNNPEMFSLFMDITGGKFADTEDYVIALLWYDPDLNGETFTPSNDKFYSGEDVISLRKGWDNNDAFVGIHAGKTRVSHSHLDGASFIYEWGGVRWAVDPGAGNYNQVGYWDSADNGQRWNIFLIRAESHNCIVTNPSLLPDHKLDSYANLTLKDSDENGAIAVVDTSELLYDVSKSQRGFFFTDSRESLVIRDEISLTKESDIYWFMQTKADVSTDENGAILTENGKTLRLDFITNGEGEITFEDCKPLPTSPIEQGDRLGDSYNVKRIAIKVRGEGDVSITVKLTPSDIESSSVTQYDKPIDEWTLKE